MEKMDKDNDLEDFLDWERQWGDPDSASLPVIKNDDMKKNQITVDDMPYYQTVRCSCGWMGAAGVFRNHFCLLNYIPVGEIVGRIV